MCIVLITRTKKHFIVLSNRDEYLARPTAQATWWPHPHSHVLGGRDLVRPEHGTWLGITRQGRFAVLTNYREQTEAQASSAACSRGEITNGFLLSEKPVHDWIQEVLSSGVYKDVGGFSLMCTILRENSPGMAIISNRTTLDKGADYVLGVENEVMGYECEGLSNSLYHDEWPKVKLGKELLRKLIEKDIQDEESLIEEAFELLLTNSFTEMPTFDTLRDSIFIPKWAAPPSPPVAAPVDDHTITVPEAASTDHPRWYATRQQTVILVSREDGRVLFTERTLWDERGEPVNREKRDVKIEFTINGWAEE